jgi:hypothetical protein
MLLMLCTALALAASSVSTVAYILTFRSLLLEYVQTVAALLQSAALQFRYTHAQQLRV